MIAILILCVVVGGLVYYQVFTQGLFSTLIMAVLSLVSAVIALNYYEPLATLLNDLGLANFGLGPMADKDRLAAPLDGQLGAGLDAADIDEDRRQRLNVGRGVHLIDHRPDGGAGCHRAGAGRCVIEEIPPGACVIFCVGHVSLSFPEGRARPDKTDGPRCTRGLSAWLLAIGNARVQRTFGHSGGLCRRVLHWPLARTVLACGVCPRETRASQPAETIQSDRIEAAKARKNSPAAPLTAQA